MIVITFTPTSREQPQQNPLRGRGVAFLAAASMADICVGELALGDEIGKHQRSVVTGLPVPLW